MIDTFIDNIENTFGKYKAGMSYSIRQKLAGLSQESMDILTDKITREYDMARPPSLKVVLGVMAQNNIHGGISKYYSCSVCESCGKEFSFNSLECPYCKQRRMYGVIKILKDKPPWHDQEIRQMLKDKMEIQDDRNKKEDKC